MWGNDESCGGDDSGSGDKSGGGNEGSVFVSQFSIAENSHNKQFKQIRNAWQFWFAVSFVFMAQCSSNEAEDQEVGSGV